MALVEVRKTPFAQKDFARAILIAWRNLAGEIPSKETAGIMWAQYAIETGAGGACWNFNLFNHKVTQAMAAAGVPFMMLRNTWEIDPKTGARIVYQPPHPATWFRAYDSFAESMAEHLNALKNGRYASAWGPLAAGDPDGYCARLRERSYFTQVLDVYQRALRARLAMWMQAPAFDDALAELVAASEAPTMPVLPDSPPDTDPEKEQPIVHPDVPLDPPDPKLEPNG